MLSRLAAPQYYQRVLSAARRLARPVQRESMSMAIPDLALFFPCPLVLLPSYSLVARLPQVLESLLSLSQEEARHDLAHRQREKAWHSVGQQGRGEVDSGDGGPQPEPLDGGYELRSLRHAYQTAHLQHMLR